MVLLRGSLRRLAATVGVSLVVLVVHQLSYLDQLALPSPLSESMEVLKVCPRPRESNNSVGSGIPNIVHQIWKTADVRTYSTEASHQLWKATLNPMNYTVKLWTDDNVLGLIKATYPWLLSTYEGYPRDIQRADIARLVVVHAEGGMYADLDVHPKSVGEISCLQHLGLQGIFAPTEGTLGLSNHFFMAERGSAFLQWTLHEAKRRAGPTSKRILLPYLQVFWSTGPMMVTSAFRKYAQAYGSGHQLGVLDDSFGRTVIQHAAGRSWHETDGRLFNYLSDNATVKSPWVAVPLLAAVWGLVYLMVRRYGSPASCLLSDMSPYGNSERE